MKQEVTSTQIQLSTHEFRVFYGDDFTDWTSTIFNAAAEYDVDFVVHWHKEFCIISMLNVNKKVWHDLLFEFFAEACSEEEDEK